MKNGTLGGFSSANAFVEAKLKRFDSMERTFRSLREMMFSEKRNVLYEQSKGFQIVTTTYGEAYERIRRRTATLRALLADAQPNAAVGIYMRNSLEWIEVFWSVLSAGFRPLLMNLRLDDDTLASALAQTEAVAVISDEKRFGVRTLLADEVVPADEPGDAEVFGTELLVMSSGTSSSIKICAYSAQEFYYQIHDSFQIICECRQMKKMYKGNIKQLAFLPFYHVFGLIAMYIWFGFFSRTFVHLSDLAPQTILNTIRRHEVTHIFAVPLLWDTVYAQALKTIKERGEATWRRFNRALAIADRIGDTPCLGPLFRRLAFREVRANLFGNSISFLISGGSEIRPQVIRFFNHIGYHLADGYGMTEIGITSVELSSRARVLNACFVGKPMSSIQYRIGPEGELWVRGGATAKYIIENGRVTPNDDWFNTHDLAECIDGRYRILGRKDDLVVAPSGENLNPNVIEPRFALSGASAVCLIRTEDDGCCVPTLLVAVNRHLPSERLTAVEQQARARIAELGLSAQIGRVALVAEPLMTAQEFKLNRTRLARDYAAGTLPLVHPHAAASAQDEDELYAVIRQAFATALDKDAGDVGDDADFFLDEGGTSLDYFAMVSALQEEFSIAFPTVAGKSLSTVRAFHDYTEAALKDAD